MTESGLMESQRIFFFGDGQAQGGNEVKHLIGGKGASLAEMTKAGLQVPPGFTISAECCKFYHENQQAWPDGLKEEIRENIARLEQTVQQDFGRGDNPLLLAVRSGAAESMPGMLNTILNVGLNPGCVEALAQRTGDALGAWRSYRDFLVTFGVTVGGVGEHVYTHVLIGVLEELDLDSETQMTAEMMKLLCERFQVTYRAHTRQEMPTDPFELLYQAVEMVFRSWNNDRAVAYRRHHKITGLLGTAVNVQMMCPSEVSGVLFTAHPIDPSARQMVVESTYGLGEAVVLGKVTPDRFTISRDTFEILERRVADKRTLLHSMVAYEPDLTPARMEPSLTTAQLEELIQLGLKVEKFFGHPCDIEWGLSLGEFYLLQARPIKRGGLTETDELEQVRRLEITRLRELAEPNGTVWSRYNLYEVLPEPTPMTWSVVQKLMSGAGGFGQMYRDLGFDPDPELDELGIYDLVCGRPYCNLSREPKLYYQHLPYEHAFDELKQEAHKAHYPKPRFNPSKMHWSFYFKIPFIFFKLFRAELKLRRISQSFPRRFQEEILPPFLEEVELESQTDFSTLDGEALLERLHYWIQRTLFDFARHSLKPTALAERAQDNLLSALARLKTRSADLSENIGQPPTIHETLKKARASLRRLVMGIRPPPEADLAGAVHDLAAGKMNRETFLKHFGHRGRQEMELSFPRWREDPDALSSIFSQDSPVGNEKPAKNDAVPGDGESKEEEPSPLAEFDLSEKQRILLERELELLHNSVALREVGKHHLMRGYALIRRILTELDRRYKLGGGIFFLTLEELPDLLAGKNLDQTIESRRRRRYMLLQLPVPPVLFSDDLEAIGRIESLAECPETFQGVPLSAGVAIGPALVFDAPPSSPPLGNPYILVCPSTDPAWLPLFIQARAIVMETGGMLSHGAIVAREFGLPAVAGLPNIHRLVQSGQRLQVDGSTGRVNILE